MKARIVSAASAAGLLLATGLAMTLAAPAYAQLYSDLTLFDDPTAFHVQSPMQSGTDPVLLNQSNFFDVMANDLPSKETIQSPLQIFLLVPTTQAAPVVANSLYLNNALNVDAFTLTLETTQWNTATDNSFYKDYLGCQKCDGSINANNVATAEGTVGLEGTLFNVYDLSVAINSGNGFTAATEFEAELGTFAKGTIVAPFDINTTDQKVYDTSWTNAGFVNTTDAGAVPEPRTWVMMLAGFGMLGFAAMRKGKREARLAV